MPAMKKWVAVLGGAMFVVLFLSMYTVVDQLSRTTDYKDVRQLQFEEKVKFPIQELEKDMKNLENSIEVSRTVISHMKNAADQLGAKRNTPFTEPEGKDHITKLEEDTKILKKTVQQTKYIDFNAIAANLSNEDGCVFSKTPSGTSSKVKMLDVFDALPFDNPDGGAWKQGWDVQYPPNAFDEEPLQVFVVPHSHNDPGWIKTLDQYYQDQTRHILDNIVDALAHDARRKFIWAETSYFSMWWSDADEHRKTMCKKQLANGQLEIVTGGWVMNDEANTHYYAMVDQMIEGNQWMLGTMGVKPRAGWAIDPFGHSPTMAYILKAMGFDAMLIQRVHYSVKKYLARNKDLMFGWRQNWDHSSSSDILCHMMPFYSYDVPHTCGPDPKICCQFDFRRLPGGGIACPWRIAPVRITDYNVAERANTLLDQYRKKAQLYKTNVVFAPLGDDFRYEKEFETVEQYTNYQKLFDYINSHPELKAKAQFGTLSDYFDAVWKSKGSKPGTIPDAFSTLSGDFFTYADRDDHYWSGYYTSRPFYKHMDRALESHHRAGEILFSLAAAHARQNPGSNPALQDMFGLLIQARRNLGVFQHHDGVTGTAKDHVVIDYGTRMLRSIQDLERVMVQSASFLLSSDKSSYKSPDPSEFQFKFGERRNGQDQLPVKEVIIVSSTPRKVVFYNSLTEFRKEVVSLHVSDTNVMILDSSGHEVPSQVNFVWERDMKILTTKYELVFLAEIPPLGLATYNIKSAPKTSSGTLIELYKYPQPVRKEGLNVEIKSPGQDPLYLENDYYKAELDGTTGLLKSILMKSDNKKTEVEVEFVQYGTRHSGDASGAYLFLPNGEAQPVHVGSPTFAITRGKIMQEARVQLPNVMHIIRLYNAPGPADRAVDIENRADIRDLNNKELVMRLKTSISNQDREFFTDLNGFQMQRRKTLDKLPLQANFYPMPEAAVIQDTNTRLTINSAQALGVASLRTGWLEIVLDRRLLRDDNRGLGQGVMDNKFTQSRFRLVLERFVAPIKQESKVPLMYPSLPSTKLSQRLNHPIYALHSVDVSKKTAMQDSFSGLKQPLPCDIFLLNLRTLQKHPTPSPSDSAALILHRKAYDCNIVNKCMLSPGALSHGKVTLENVFNNLQVKSLQSKSLNLIHDKESLSPNAMLDLKPMELYAYQIELV